MYNKKPNTGLLAILKYNWNFGDANMWKVGWDYLTRTETILLNSIKAEKMRLGSTDSDFLSETYHTESMEYPASNKLTIQT